MIEGSCVMVEGRWMMDKGEKSMVNVDSLTPAEEIELSCSCNVILLLLYFSSL